ncbi:DNA polymerase III subunit gamma/tau [Sinimarinibacterium thermocellulolyticum]|uniref:DNA polymerase III subunit gamma/tau n=1 Tax=Sinimarinibacterium thermocellulolyticum TaxID=3170016 RepID=A0ABV2AAZ6_9GAMM
MSYLALARKYRPRRFEDVVGQDHVVKALAHALAGDKLHPAILLTGTRGVGKTTLARIVAKCLNCEIGVSANPCGRCSACVEVDQGRFVDLLEIDAASNTSVDDVRQLIDNAQYAPARGRYKVYLIDEVHMLSKSAFNALLKTLEEPPPHVKFILATTDPQKLPVTVLSRCLQFNLKRLPVAVIREQLGKVLDAENVPFEPGAVAEIARAADGSMRDGLSLLDQAIAFSGGQPLAHSGVEEMLGTSGRDRLYELLRALSAGNAEALREGLQALDAQAPDYAALLSDLATALQRIAVLQMLPGARSEDDDEALLALVPQFTPEHVQLLYQIAVNGRRDLPWAPAPRIGFEMSVLRMLAFQPIDGEAGVPTPSLGRGSAQAAATGADAAGSAAHSAAADLPWEARVAALPLDGFARQLARHCAFIGQEGNLVRLRLDVKLRHLLVEERRAALEAALSQQAGRALRVEIEQATDETLPTPAQLAQQREIERQRAAETTMQADPVVRAFQEQFGARIRPGSVRVLDS